MKRLVTLALLTGAAALASGAAAVAPDNTLSDAEKGQGRKLLFDGRSLAGWLVTGNKEGWAIEEGAVACLARGGGYLYTAEQFGDFTLALDYKVDKGVNSGVFIRWADLKDPVNTGMEVQVLDSYGRDRPGRHDDAAIDDLVAPSKNKSRPAGEWNRAEITCRGPQITVALNGEKVTEMDLDRWTTAGQNPDGSRNKFRAALKDFARKGHIGLQDHGGRVWFKNVKVRALPAG